MCMVEASFPGYAAHKISKEGGRTRLRSNLRNESSAPPKWKNGTSNHLSWGWWFQFLKTKGASRWAGPQRSKSRRDLSGRPLPTPSSSPHPQPCFPLGHSHCAPRGFILLTPTAAATAAPPPQLQLPSPWRIAGAPGTRTGRCAALCLRLC